MKFRQWLEGWNDTTVSWHPNDGNQFDPYASTMAPATQGMGKDRTWGSNSRYQTPDTDTLPAVAIALDPLSFDDTEDGFSGTPDYASPEQFQSVGFRHPDFYQSFLDEVAQLFPDMAEECKNMKDNWMLFRQEVLRRVGKKQYMGSGQKRYPIHYALPLRTLQIADPAFDQVKQILDSDNNPDLANIKRLFMPLYVQHKQLAKRINGPLSAMLQAARNNPASYEPVNWDQEPPAAAAGQVG